MPLFRGSFSLESAVIRLSVSEIFAEVLVSVEEICTIVSTIMEKRYNINMRETSH